MLPLGNDSILGEGEEVASVAEAVWKAEVGLRLAVLMAHEEVGTHRKPQFLRNSVGDGLCLIEPPTSPTLPAQRQRHQGIDVIKEPSRGQSSGRHTPQPASEVVVAGEFHLVHQSCRRILAPIDAEGAALRQSRMFLSPTQDMTVHSPVHLLLKRQFQQTGGTHIQLAESQALAADDALSGEEEFLKALTQAEFTVTKLGTEPVRPAGHGEYTMVMDGIWYRLNFIGKRPTDSPVAELDVSVLQERVLKDILGIENPQNDPRLAFLNGTKGIEALQTATQQGMKVAFAIMPIAMPEIIKVADAGLTMPPKSTCFDPKPVAGLVIYLVREI